VYAKYVFSLAGDFWRGYRKNGGSLQAAYKTKRKPSQTPLHHWREHPVT